MSRSAWIRPADADAAAPTPRAHVGRLLALRPRVTARIVSVLLALVWSLAAGGEARAASEASYFGTNLQTLGAARGDQEPFLRSLADGQMSISRFEVDWRSVERTPEGQPCARQYAWAGIDALITRMARHGIRATPTFRYTPACVWARTSAGAVDELPAAGYGELARLFAAFAARYGPGGAFWAAHPELPDLGTRSYEVWNEVNLDEYAWNGRADPVALTALMRVVRPAVRAVQPAAVLLASVAWQNRPQDGQGVYPSYVPALAAAGGLGLFDAVGYHPYAPDAQATFDLVVRLRAEMDAAGFPAMPIYANEAGQPVLNGAERPPFPAGHESWATDAGRGANLAFAGEALALSDCRVEHFFAYSVAGYETAEERLNEGYMGILFRDSGLPTATGAAMQRASRRWVARLAGGAPAEGARLGLCSGRPSPPESLLPIAATLTGQAATGCVGATASYDGGPLAGAYLQLRRTDGSPLALARTDRLGGAVACVEPFLLKDPFVATVEVAGAGTSGRVVCNVPGVGCPAGQAFSPAVGQTLAASDVAGVPAATPPPTKAPPAAAASKCEWKLTTKRRSVTRDRGGRVRVRIRAGVTCPSVRTGTGIRFVVSVKTRKSKREQRIRSVFLKVGRTTEFTAVRGFARTDRVVLTHAGDRLRDVPRLRSTLLVGRAAKKR